MHIKKTLKELQTCIFNHLASTVVHVSSCTWPKKILPACGVHYEVCMPSWHACFHLFCNIWFSNEDCMGIHTLLTSQGLNTKVAHKIFIL